MVETVEKIEVREENPAQLDEVGKVLLKARDYIHAYGWCQNQFMNYMAVSEMPEVCLLGAINWVMELPVEDDEWNLNPRKRMYMERLGFGWGYQATNWNDTTDRTQQEVEERLERAAYNIP